MRRESSLRRRPPRLQPAKRILVVVEGKVTEYRYFLEIQREVPKQLLEIVLDNESGVPKTLVERAARLKKDAAKDPDAFMHYDEVWCVHDVDDHPKIEDARQQAQAHDIQLAISNPSFELWALLHFRDLRAYQEREKVRALLKEHLPQYEKELDFTSLHQAKSYFSDRDSAYYTAANRAKDLDEMQSKAGTPGENPSTGVYRLTDSIREQAVPVSVRLDKLECQPQD